ncbi:MAG: Ig-like domain-containing protein [Myxococcota bacterium]
MRVSALLLLPSLLLGCPPQTDPKETGADDTGEANTAPALTIDSPADGAAYDLGDVVTVAGFVADDRDEPTAVAVTVNDEAATVGEDGTFSVDLTLDAGEHTLSVTATDSEGLSSTATRTVSVSAVPVDEAPTAPVVHVEPGDPITGDTLSVVIDAESVDPEGANVTYTFSWTADGVAAGEGETAGPVTRGQEWVVTVVASDGALSSEAATASVTAGNAAPTGTGVTLSPAAPTVADTIACAVEGVADAEGDAVTETYAFTVDGVAAGDGTATLQAGAAAAGQSVVCDVTLDDGWDAVTLSSDALVVVNTAPGAPTVEVTPVEPADTDDLACAVVADAVDPDGDALTYTYAWSVDGVATGYATETIPADETHRDEVWTCEVVASDGAASGPAASASVTIGLAWSGDEAASAAWGTIDGAVASGAFGKAIALPGDMDGDGLSELVVSANGESSSAGAVYLFAGADLGGAITTADAIASWDGEHAEGQLGGFRAVAAPGDLDDDGVADFMFAAPDADANGDGSGIAYLFHGGGSWGLDADPGDADWTVGATANDQVGPRLLAMDLDGDAYEEIVVSAPGDSVNAREAGTVAIFEGTGGRRSGATTTADADQRIFGDAESDELGWTLKDIGDVDGDGYADLFTTSIYADPSGSSSGTGGLVLGGVGIGGSGVLADVATALFTGDAENDRMGYDAVGRVDLDEDGVEDLLVAEYQDDAAATDAGAVYVFLGRGRWATSYAGVDADHAILGDGASSRFGHVMSSPGDLDSDGRDDLLIGALFASPTGLSYQGAAYLISSPDWASASSAADLAWSSYGEAASDLYGDALGVGRADLDGDGRNDFVVGAQGHDTGGTSAGRVYLWRGR